MAERVDAIVVGGGLAGLSAALELKAQGRAVVVLEGGARLGGKAGSVFSPFGVLPTGPTSFNGRHAAIWKLVRLLGLEDEALRLSPRSGARYVVRDGRLQGLQPNPLSVLTTGALTFSEKLALAKDLLGRRRTTSTEDETLDAFLERRFGRNLVDHFFAAVMTGIFAGDLKQLSAASCLPALVNAEKEYGSVLRGALKSLSRKDEGSKPGLYTFARGMGRLAEKAADLLDARLSAKVTSVSPSAGRVTVTTAEGQVLEAQSVVLAVEAAPAASLVAPWAPSAAEVLRSFKYAPVTLVSWVETEPGTSKLPHGFGYLVAPIEECFALGMLFVGDLLAEEPRRFSTFVGGALFPDRAAAPLEVLAEGVGKDLSRLTGGRLGQVVDVQRWPAGVFQPPPGHARQLERLSRGLGEPRVALAGSYLGGAAMKDAIESGFKAAARLLGTVSPAAQARPSPVEVRA